MLGFVKCNGDNVFLFEVPAALFTTSRADSSPQLKTVHAIESTQLRLTRTLNKDPSQNIGWLILSWIKD